jgi:hypothetical protein
VLDAIASRIPYNWNAETIELDVQVTNRTNVNNIRNCSCVSGFPLKSIYPIIAPIKLTNTLVIITIDIMPEFWDPDGFNVITKDITKNTAVITVDATEIQYFTSAI